MTTLPFAVGDRVRVVGHYTWCGQDTNGREGVVDTIETYPPGVVDGDALFMVRDHGSPIPLTAADLERI